MVFFYLAGDWRHIVFLYLAGDWRRRLPPGITLKRAEATNDENGLQDEDENDEDDVQNVEGNDEDDDDVVSVDEEVDELNAQGDYLPNRVTM